MLDELTPRQWDEWEAYFQLEPFGSLSEARPMALLIALVGRWLGADQAPDEIMSAWGFDLQTHTSEIDSESAMASIVCALGAI